MTYRPPEGHRRLRSAQGKRPPPQQPKARSWIGEGIAGGWRYFFYDPDAKVRGKPVLQWKDVSREQAIKLCREIGQDLPEGLREGLSVE